MKLTSEDKELLTKWGHKEGDFDQIERATTKTTYEMDSKKISTSEAIDTLGREKYLSGISRSAFHWSACRQNETGDTVCFDSSRLFR
ncbi:MAG: hypothetical protein ABFD25_00865 [Clostridiaceae bacterium]